MVLASDEILAAGKPAFQGDLPPPSPSKESLMLISLATGKRGSWQLHRGEHPACISGGHPLSLQGKEKPLQSRTHARPPGLLQIGHLLERQRGSPTAEEGEGGRRP